MHHSKCFHTWTPNGSVRWFRGEVKKWKVRINKTPFTAGSLGEAPRNGALDRKAKQAKSSGLQCKNKTGIKWASCGLRATWATKDSMRHLCPGGEGVRGGGGYLPPFSLIPFQTIKAPQFSFLRGTHHSALYLLLALGEWERFGFDYILNFSSLWNRSYLQKSVCNIYGQFKENKKPSTTYTTPNVSNQILPIHWNLLCGPPSHRLPLPSHPQASHWPNTCAAHSFALLYTSSPSVIQP